MSIRLIMIMISKFLSRYIYAGKSHARSREDLSCLLQTPINAFAKSNDVVSWTRLCFFGSCWSFVALAAEAVVAIVVIAQGRAFAHKKRTSMAARTEVSALVCVCSTL